MKKYYLNLIITSFLLIVSSYAQADMSEAKGLHQQNCTKCHGSEVYTRENTRVKNLPGLGKQVRFCKNNLGLSWFDDEVSDVINYLDTTYYKF